MLSLILPVAFLALAAPANSAQFANPAPVLQDNIVLNPAVGDPGAKVCLKLRVYQFERNDGQAPRLVRETTCTTVRPFLKRTEMPKAKFVPAK